MEYIFSKMFSFFKDKRSWYYIIMGFNLSYNMKSKSWLGKVKTHKYINRHNQSTTGKRGGYTRY
jgi:hypothetical protein